MVTGLEIQTNPSDRGIFAVRKNARKAAGTIWKGIGIMHMNRPIMAPRETDLRLKCQRFVSLMRPCINFKEFMAKISSREGILNLRSFNDIAIFH